MEIMDFLLIDKFWSRELFFCTPSIYYSTHTCKPRLSSSITEIEKKGGNGRVEKGVLNFNVSDITDTYCWWCTNVWAHP